LSMCQPQLYRIRPGVRCVTVRYMFLDRMVEYRLSLTGFAAAHRVKLNTITRASRKNRLFFMGLPLSDCSYRQVSGASIQKAVPELRGGCPF